MGVFRVQSTSKTFWKVEQWDNALNKVGITSIFIFNLMHRLHST